jgi:hypothetical protein
MTAQVCGRLQRIFAFAMRREPAHPLGMKQRLLHLCAISCAVLLAAPRLAHAQEPAPAAAELLQRMASAYAAAQSYADKSFARYTNPDGTERFHVDYRIWFARPSRMRIDAESKREGFLPRREVLWSDATTIRMWAPGKPVTARAEVKLAGSGMFGTYAYHVPTLLDASYGGAQRLHEITSPALGGEEEWEGTPCWRITGDWLGDKYEVWLGKADHLVRRIVARYKDHQLEEIHREIVVDSPVAPEVFRFAPEQEVDVPKPSPSPTPSPTPAAKGSPSPKKSR